MSKPAPISHRNAWIELTAGVLVAIAGVVITLLTFGEAEAAGGTYVIAFGPIVAGVALVMHALSDLAGYRSFVAWRYLLVSEQRVHPVVRHVISRTVFLLVCTLLVATPIALAWPGARLPMSGVVVVISLALLVAQRQKLALPVVVRVGLEAISLLALSVLIVSARHSRGITMIVAGVLFVALFFGVVRFSRPSYWLGLTGLFLLLQGGLATVPRTYLPLTDAFGGAQYALLAVAILTLVVLVVLRARLALWQRMSLRLVALVAATLVIAALPHLGFVGPTIYLLVMNIVMIAGGVLVGLATFVGSLRAFFTFFTTVPIVGVWIGTLALVCVLAVMSGFESDLREKILGSNAHIQITREDGEFNDWKAIKARIDKVPGVVASTPYAVSEVVIAAHNNGMNVIIKGIDPATVANVTDLVSDLEDKTSITRLEPLIETTTDLSVPQKPHDANAVDPAPSDLPTADDPIDYSVGADAEPAPPTTPATTGAGGIDKMLEPPIAPAEPPADDEPAPAEYGGDARAAQTDPPPADFTASPGDPADFSDAGVDFEPLDTVRIDAVDVPEPSLSRRTQSLHGVLVGRELQKQTHLYTGEEVRVVSPLSDPSNPDATGTPIPFNRDYRVAGIFFTGMYEYDLKYVYVTLDSLQDFLDRGDAIDGIEVRVTHADDSGHMVAVLMKELGPSYRIVDWRELNRSLFSALKLEKIAMFLVLGIVILVASFSIVGNLIMVVVEKQRQIALLKTLGASNSGMMQLFGIQGLMIGMIGTVLGVSSGLLACWAGKRYGLPLNPDVYYIDRLPIHVDPQSVAAAAAAGILISIAATLYPALLAARVRPAAGMRH